MTKPAKTTVLTLLLLATILSCCHLASAARRLMRAEAKHIETETDVGTLPDKLFYHPAASATIHCSAALDLSLSVPGDPAASLDFKTLTQNIAWTLKTVAAPADHVFQNQTLTGFSFLKDGKPYDTFNTGDPGVLELLKGRPIAVELGPSLKILDARINEIPLSRQSPYIRQFLSFYLAAALFPPQGIPLVADSKWQTFADFPLPGIDDSYRIALNARLTDIRKVADIDCALVAVEARDALATPPNPSIRYNNTTFTGEFCFALADGIPVYGETDLKLQAFIHRDGVDLPLNISMRSRQTARIQPTVVDAKQLK